MGIAITETNVNPKTHIIFLPPLIFSELITSFIQIKRSVRDVIKPVSKSVSANFQCKILNKEAIGKVINNNIKTEVFILLV